jgi:hypothetical protein
MTAKLDSVDKVRDALLQELDAAVGYVAPTSINGKQAHEWLTKVAERIVRADTIAAEVEGMRGGCAEPVGHLYISDTCMDIETKLDIDDARKLLGCGNHPLYTHPKKKPAPINIVRTGRCEYKKQAGGCPHHNLQCGYPKCDEYPPLPQPPEAG